MLNKSTVFPIIHIVISLKVIAIISITLLFMFVVPLRIPSLDDTEKSLYKAAEELGVNEQKFCRYCCFMPEEASLLREMVETGTDPVYATRLFLDLAKEEYSSMVIEFVLGGGLFLLCGVYIFIKSLISLMRSTNSMQEYSIL